MATLSGDTGAALVSRLLAFDRANGVVHVFDASDGHAAGAAKITTRPPVDENGNYDESARPAETYGVFAATGDNLGGIYRNGALTMVVDATTPVLRLTPLNGVANALSLNAGVAIAPRGDSAPQLPAGLDLGGDFTPTP